MSFINFTKDMKIENLSKKNKAILAAVKKGYKVTKEGKVTSEFGEVKLNNNKDGYPQFSIRLFSEVVKVSVHRLQCYQKYGDKIFKKGIVCRHLDSNPSNNSFDNLSIGTQSQNMMDMPKEKRILNASNPKHNHNEIVKDYYESKLSYSKLMVKYGIKSKGTISHIIKSSLASQKYGSSTL